MSMQTTNESSVSIALAELARMEQERVREEELERVRAEEKRAEEAQQAILLQRIAIEERLSREHSDRVRSEREEAEARARRDARERAAAEVARIEAAAKAKLDADNAVRAHELAILQARRVQHAGLPIRVLTAALGGLLGVAVCGWCWSARKVEESRLEAEKVHQSLQEFARAVEEARTTELLDLDRRLASLRQRPFANAGEPPFAAAELARGEIAVGAERIEANGLHRFAHAIADCEVRLRHLENLAALDQRQVDLTTWAGQRRADTTFVRAAAALAKSKPDDEASTHEYERAMDRLRETLAAPSAVSLKNGPSSPPSPSTRSVGASCGPEHRGDPLCGLNNRPL